MCLPYLWLIACSRYAGCSHAAIEHNEQSQRQPGAALKLGHCVAQVVAEELVHGGGKAGALKLFHTYFSFFRKISEFLWK